MCDPISAILAAATAGSSLLGLAKKTPKPPPTPAVAAPTPVDNTADVRNQEDKADKSTAPEYTGFVEQRKSAPTIGGLGRSGLAL